MLETISFQPELRQVHPEVLGNVDYSQFRETLERMNDLIEGAQLDIKAIAYVLEKAELAEKDSCKEHGKIYKGLSVKRSAFLKKQAYQAFRCSIAYSFKGLSVRNFSVCLADSRVLQSFCGIEQLEKIQVPSKSSLDRFIKMFPESWIEECCHQLNRDASSPSSLNQEQKLALKKPLSLGDLYLDSTCMELNVHFPVDWVLLRDATRSLMKAVTCIRKRGLKHRMEDPKKFLSRMNKCCIKMTHVGRQKDGRKKRKAIFREMKKLMSKIKKHAERHLSLLREHFEKTDLSFSEAKQIMERIENILNQLPKAVKQAHERLIGGRLFKNEDKILSFYEHDAHVIVRKKSGKNIEFGNTLFLAEQIDGVLVDWKLHQKNTPGDATLISGFIERVESHYPSETLKSVSTDRGFYSKKNKKILKQKNIQDFMCPKSVSDLTQRLEESSFSNKQKRRAQTEARIAIFKNKFLGKPIRSKGFQNQNTSFLWGILAHNLWVIARLPQASQELEKAA